MKKRGCRRYNKLSAIVEDENSNIKLAHPSDVKFKSIRKRR